MKKFRKDSAITLIALVVTIVVLMILATVSIVMLTGENGTINRAKIARDETHIANEKEIVQLSAMGAKDYITKEIDESKLRTELTNHIGGVDEYVLTPIGKMYEVMFTDCGRIYTINTDGTVRQGEVSKGITLNKNQLSLQIINTTPTNETLVATLENIEGTIIWTSENEEIATVDNNGTVTSVGKGETTITATYGEYTATCKVLVTITDTNNPIVGALGANLVEDDSTVGTYTFGEYTNKDVEVYVSNTGSDAETAVTTTFVIKKNGLETTTEYSQTDKATLTEEGIYEITITTKDEGGNTAQDTKTVLIDKTAPQIIVQDQQFNENVYGMPIYIQEVIDEGAGIGDNPIFICYNIDENSSNYGKSSTTEEVTCSGNSYNILVLLYCNRVRVTVEDLAGNIGIAEFNATWKSCFVAGTQVSTPQGLRNIEEIKVGDTVYSYNEETQQIEEQKVTKAYIFESNIISTITFENGEQIKNTPVHPYYVVGKGWTETKDLKVGDEILTQDKTKIKIENIQLENVEEINVYNIKVENNHNYFIGNTKFLVHNKA